MQNQQPNPQPKPPSTQQQQPPQQHSQQLAPQQQSHPGQVGQQQQQQVGQQPPAQNQNPGKPNPLDCSGVFPNLTDAACRSSSGWVCCRGWTGSERVCKAGIDGPFSPFSFSPHEHAKLSVVDDPFSPTLQAALQKKRKVDKQLVNLAFSCSDPSFGTDVLCVGSHPRPISKPRSTRSRGRTSKSRVKRAETLSRSALSHASDFHPDPAV